MELNRVLAEATESIGGCVAAGVVDMESGELIDVKTVDSHPQVILDMVSAATSDLFQGENVVTIEKLFKQARGLPSTDNEHYFYEFIAISKNLIHVFLRGKRHLNQVLVIVTKLNSNLGLVLNRSRGVLRSVESAQENVEDSRSGKQQDQVLSEDAYPLQVAKMGSAW